MTALPTLIQGGMGIAVSSWTLAKVVSRKGQLGVVSGTALDAVVARRLQDGDPTGDYRRALAHFPSQAMAERVLSTYYRPDGRQGRPYRPHPTLGIKPSREAIELCLVSNFAEVWLAKEGHRGVVGINLLEKVQTAILSATMGAILAGVDYVIMGAGIPKQMPHVLTNLAAGRRARYVVDVANATTEHAAELDPVEAMGEDLPRLRRPKFLAIVSAHVLAAYLNRSADIRPDGFIVEGPTAGGHSAPPRGKMNLDDTGQPIYGPKDLADLAAMAALGLPFWLAGAYGTPERVAEAVDAGAAGVQVGTVFALSAESGIRPELREKMIRDLRGETLVVANDPLASPTGFPFKIAQVEGTLADEKVYAARGRICDLGYLRTPVEREGEVVYRCASEPVHMYVKKGGQEPDTVGRDCLCNALLATIGLGQVRKGVVEPPVLTLGQDLDGPRRLLAAHPGGYCAGDAVDWLTSEVHREQFQAVSA